MSNELRDEQTIAIDMAIGDALGWPNGVYDATDAVLAAIAATTSSSQTLRRALGALHVVEEDHYGRYCKSCSTNDRRVTDPCPTHRVLREFDMGELPGIPDSSPTPQVVETDSELRDFIASFNGDEAGDLDDVGAIDGSMGYVMRGGNDVEAVFAKAKAVLSPHVVDTTPHGPVTRWRNDGGQWHEGSKCKCGDRWPHPTPDVGVLAEVRAYIERLRESVRPGCPAPDIDGGACGACRARWAVCDDLDARLNPEARR